MGHAEGDGLVRIAVFYAPENAPADLRFVALPTGATVAQALEVCGLRNVHPERAGAEILAAIDGRRVSPQQVLRDGDRIDLCGPLRVEPMTARRLRAAAARNKGRSKPGG
ncbi:RnfH family protein [Thiomonas intermedia]|uniref:RnfH family protein n=1 Tax=Thiomonas intermedia TaxID=926 RepID=UPI0009A4895F|nr:RnfH family protein [Thiomonas intermedia]MCE1163210.1 RnfH family protein [Thiomonas sp.]